jgi:DNA-binding LacI/PurR family transcriptional regulator
MVNVPTAIMYPDDYSAVIGLKVIKNKGLDCPSDISITGFDGVEIGSITSPSITTIKQDTKKIGQELARRLIDAMEDKNAKPSLIEIKSTLEIRESTSVPRKGEI